LMPIMIFMTRFYHSKISSCSLSAVKLSIINSLRLSILGLIVVIAQSCEEGSSPIGNDLLPGRDFVDVKSCDTISFKSYTMFDDSARTDSPSPAFIGGTYDPYFGTTTAEYVSQIRLGAAWVEGVYTVDSVKLYLQIETAKGSGAAGHKLRITEIDNQLYTDSVYYSTQSVKPGAFDITDIMMPELRTDTINNIKLDLPISFGQYILRDPEMLFHSNTKPDFRSYFKGIYIRMYSSADPLLISISLTSPTTFEAYKNYITIYMHDDAGTSSEYHLFLDAINKNAAYNRFIFDHNTAEPDKKIKHINDNFSDTLSYIQYLSGVYTKIIFPGLAAMRANAEYKNIAINKARVTVPVQYDGAIYKASTAPAQLIMRYRTSSGGKYIVPDYSIDSYSSFYDGKIDTIANEYKFNVAKFLQSYFDDKKGEILPELDILQLSDTKNVILKTEKAKKPVRFDFTYTKF
jgi:hypothetical protein